MTKRLSNQEIERHYFEKFQNVYSLPPGKISYGDRPDIILTCTKTIGIEVTRFYIAQGGAYDSEQRQKPLRNEVVAAAQKLYRAAGGKGMELWIGFNPANPITSARRKSLPSEIVDFSLRLENIDSNKFLIPQTKPPEVEAVYFTGDDYPAPHWRVWQVYTLKNMSLEALEEIIRGKEAKSNEYRACDAYWLLVIVDWTDRAQDQEIQIDGINIRSNIFEKIIVYKPGFEHVVEINLDS